MKIFARKWLGLAVALVAGLSLGLAAAPAEAQVGFSYNSPGLSIGINQPAYYGGYYQAPVVVPAPVIVPPPVVYGPRPYYPAAYGAYRGGYYGGYRGGYPGPHHGGGYPGGGYGPRRPYY